VSQATLLDLAKAPIMARCKTLPSVGTELQSITYGACSCLLERDVHWNLFYV